MSTKYVKHTFLILGVFGFTTLACFIFLKKYSKTISTSTPTPGFANTEISSNFSLEEAPSESLKGIITKMDGEINFLGRTATEEATLSSTSASVQQGENYITGIDSSLLIVFENAAAIDMGQETEVDIIQTLPANLVFSQIDGTVKYTRIGDYPVTIRTSYLLSQITGEVIIERNIDKSIVTIKINSGSVTFAYNDKNLISHIIEANKGQTFTFNYGTRRGVLK